MGSCHKGAVEPQIASRHLSTKVLLTRAMMAERHQALNPTNHHGQDAMLSWLGARTDSRCRSDVRDHRGWCHARSRILRGTRASGSWGRVLSAQEEKMATQRPNVDLASTSIRPSSTSFVVCRRTLLLASFPLRLTVMPRSGDVRGAACPRLCWGGGVCPATSCIFRETILTKFVTVMALTESSRSLTA